MSLRLPLAQVVSADPTQAALNADGRVIFDYNGLATRPIRVERGPGGFLGWFTVPPGCSAVVTGPAGRMKVFSPGTHPLQGFPPGETFIQLVKASPELLHVQNVKGHSREGWPVELDMVARVIVVDPRAIVHQTQPLDDLRSLLVSSAMSVVEKLPLAVFLGLQPDPSCSRRALAEAILTHVRSLPPVNGLTVIRIDVSDRRGDERQLQIVRQAQVSQAELEAKRRLQEMEHHFQLEDLAEQERLAQREREVALFRAETERLTAATRQQFDLDKANVEAEALKAIWDARRPEREWNLRREEMLKSLEAVVQAFQALAMAYAECLKVEAIRWPLWGSAVTLRPDTGGDGSGDGMLSNAIEKSMKEMTDRFSAILSGMGSFSRDNTSNGHGSEV